MNHVNEFIPVTELTKENEIPEKLISLPTQSKALRKAEEIAAMGLSSVFERSGLKFSLLESFDNLCFSLEILIFSCVVEFLEKCLIFSYISFFPDFYIMIDDWDI